MKDHDLFQGGIMKTICQPTFIMISLLLGNFSCVSDEAHEPLVLFFNSSFLIILREKKGGIERKHLLQCILCNLQSLLNLRMSQLPSFLRLYFYALFAGCGEWGMWGIDCSCIESLWHLCQCRLQYYSQNVSLRTTAKLILYSWWTSSWFAMEELWNHQNISEQRILTLYS